MSNSDEKAAPGLLKAMGEGALKRAPQPEALYGLPDAVRTQLEATPLDPERPLLALDADEVLLHFADHLGRWMEGEGFRLNLTEYRLEGAIRRIDDGRLAEGWEVGRLIKGFFASETERQVLTEGVPEALAALSEDAQIIVLTNVPFEQREARVRCLQSQGVDLPVVANAGGKGRALRWLWDRTRGPLAFVDDADPQLASSKRYAPEVFCLHFVASDGLRRLTGPARSADARAENWPEAVGLLRAALTGT